MTDDPLWAAISAARARWSPEDDARSPAAAPWGPLVDLAGDRSALTGQGFSGAVPRVPRVPSENQYIRQRTADERAADALGEWEERAAILEYEGGWSRKDAERLATEEIASGRE